MNNRKVLTLNRAMIPVDFKEPRDVFKLLCKGNAYAFDTNYMRYSFDEWIESKCLNLGEFNDNMNTVKYEIPVPPVIVLMYYERVHPMTIAPNKENVWKRDGGSCGYCGETLHLDDVTLDHIHPQSKGGPSEWFNLVTSCFSCNQKKADTLLQHLPDMPLLHDPFVPKPTSILYRLGSDEFENMPEFWKHFFVEFK